MTLFDRVSELSKKQGLSIFDLSNKLGLSRNAVYSWKTSSPKADTLDKVADYFNVSTDYLLGRTNNPYLGLSEEQRDRTVEEALKSVMSYDGEPVTEHDREILKGIIEGYLNNKVKE